MGKGSLIKIVIGVIYFIGSVGLIPGFLWIVPEKVIDIKIPVHFNATTHRPDAFATIYDIPVFGEKYGDGVRLLIIGMGFIVAASFTDLALVHCVAVTTMERKREALRILGPLFNVLGAATILYGCVVFLPSNQGLLWDGEMDKSKNGPIELFNMKASDFGTLLFKIGSVLYALGAVLAIAGIASGIKQFRRVGRSTCPLWLSLPAFFLFIATSTMFFVSSCLAKGMAIEAAWLRMGGGCSIFAAVVILCVATIVEVMDRSQGPSDEEQLRQNLSLQP